MLLVLSEMSWWNHHRLALDYFCFKVLSSRVHGIVFSIVGEQDGPPGDLRPNLQSQGFKTNHRLALVVIAADL
jgi:hypothetical protein